ncbi:MAG: ROK family protein [Actinomycetota bacterium]|nr:ROK family protein [Actinomycetota bacterium]
MATKNPSGVGHQHVGVDIGGTSTRVAVFDERLVPLGWTVDETRPASLVDHVAELVHRTHDDLGPKARPIASVGVGVPGRVDAAHGTVADAVNLGLAGEGLDLGGGLAERLGVPVTVENDVNAAALGVCHRMGLGAGPGVGAGGRTVALLSVGTGVAAGLVIDGRVHRGPTGLAGEIGHIPFDPSGPRCACGQKGCLEAVASGAALQRAWPGDGVDTPVASLLAAAGRGDETATRVWCDALDALAWAVELLVLTVDAEVVVLGGGVSEAGAPLLDGVRDALATRARTSRFLATVAVAERVRLAPGDVALGCLGAVLAGGVTPRGTTS